MSPKIDQKFDLDLVPDPVIAKQLGVTLMTIYRWDHDPKSGFPRLIKINTRNYRRYSQLIAWREKKERDTPAAHAKAKKVSANAKKAVRA